MSLVASGTVTVRDLATGAEWDEKVTVLEGELEWNRKHGHEVTVEDIARRVARNQCEGQVETLEADIS